MYENNEPAYVRTTPDDNLLLIRAIGAAGYAYDTIESYDGCFCAMRKRKLGIPDETLTND